jgi:type VI secretion system protein
MKLTLTVVASQPGNAPRGAKRALEGDQITIGRGAGCDWILPDPLNHLSKRHCIVAARGANFAVTDTSTNGVFLNEGGEPLGNGKSAALQDGDRLTLGDYVLEARIAAAEETEQRSAPTNEDDDPFGIADLMVNRPTPPVAAPLPLAHEESPFASSSQPEFGDASGKPVIPEDIAWLNEPPINERDLPARQPVPDSPLATYDHVPGQQAAYVAPRVEGGGIPDDWLNDDAAAARPASKVAAVPTTELIAAFLSGAGLPPEALRGQDGAAVMRALGRAYRAAVLGLAEILRTRALIKSEFRIEQTRIGAVGNNPLKFLDDPEALVAAMIGAPAAGFQEAGVALSDGVRDLKAHQLAMVAAIQAALARLLEQLDPEALKSRLEKRSLLDAVLPGARKARYWEAFEQSYKTIAAELEEDFNGVFGKAFAEAYEDELRRS